MRTTGGLVDLRVVGLDGAEWGRERVRAKGLARQVGVWVLTPLTAVVAVPITAGSTIAFFGYWFGYYPFFGRWAPPSDYHRVLA